MRAKYKGTLASGSSSSSGEERPADVKHRSMVASSQIGSWELGHADGYFAVGIQWVFPKIGVPQNRWFIMENLIKMDDLVVPLFSETSTGKNTHGSLPFCHLSSLPLVFSSV